MDVLQAISMRIESIAGSVGGILPIGAGSGSGREGGKDGRLRGRNG